MKTRFFLVLCVIAVAILTAVTGCGKQQTSTRPTETAPGKTPSSGTETLTASSKLGSQQNAGSFQVTLTSTPTPPQVGKVHFMTIVMKNGQHVKDANVRLTTSMTSMAGTEVTMEPMGNEYGATVDLSMPGDWTAKVDVAAGNETGTADYRFTVTK